MRRLLVAVSVCVLACEPAKSPQPPDAGPLDITDPKQLLAAIDSMQGELKDRPKSFEVLSALGNLYYENGRYLEAIDALRLALEKAAPVEAEASALRAKKIVPAKELPLECRRTGQGYGFEQIAEQARKRVATDAPAALRCYDEAL
ncbi:MAG: tetratricopeptide repeat protein, partial [Deltaproteobacteria bacterium]|nr:tetratricopeptide repeat protein [Deltaproteobacteria bacterium]